MADPTNGEDKIGQSSDSKLWEKAWSIEEMRKRSGSWTLAADAGMLNYLQEVSQKMISRTHDVQKELDTLIHDARTTDIRINNVVNDFIQLANTQFVENRVYDEDVTENTENETESTKQAKTKEEREAELIPKINSALKLGIDVLDTAFEKLNLNDANSDSEEEEECANYADQVILEVKDPYVLRPLPALIGTAAFMEDDNVGLVEPASDDDEVSDEGSLSESSEDEFSDDLDEDDDQSTKHNRTQPNPTKQNHVPPGSDLFQAASDSEGDLFGDDMSKSSVEDESASDTEANVQKSKKLDFTSELSSKLGISKTSTSNENLSENTDKVKSKKKSVAKDESDLFGDLQDEDEDSPFGTSGGLFSSKAGLFDDSPLREHDDLFSEPSHKEDSSIPKTSTSKGKVADSIFDDDEDDLFAGSQTSEVSRKNSTHISHNSKLSSATEPRSKNPSSINKTTSKGLFSDEEEDDLFTPHQSKQAQRKDSNSISSREKDDDKLFAGDDEDDLFSEAKQTKKNTTATKSKMPPGAVSMFGSSNTRSISSAIRSRKTSGTLTEDDRSLASKASSSDLFAEDQPDDLFSGSSGVKKPIEQNRPTSSDKKFGNTADEDDSWEGTDSLKPKPPSISSSVNKSSNKISHLFLDDDDDDLFAFDSKQKNQKKTSVNDSNVTVSSANRGMFDDDEESDMFSKTVSTSNDLTNSVKKDTSKKPFPGAVSMFGPASDPLVNEITTHNSENDTREEQAKISKSKSNSGEVVSKIKPKTKQPRAMFNDSSDDDLFTSDLKTKYQKNNNFESSSNVEREEEHDDLFKQSLTESNTITTSKDQKKKKLPGAVSMFGTASNPLVDEIKSKQNPTNLKKEESSQSGLKSDAPASTIKTKYKKPSAMFDDSEDEDLFSSDLKSKSKEPQKNFVNKGEPELQEPALSVLALSSSQQPTKKKQSAMFSDSDDDDLFSSSLKSKTSDKNIKQSQKPPEKAPSFSVKNNKKLAADLFGADSDEDDLFGAGPNLKSKNAPIQPSLSNTLPQKNPKTNIAKSDSHPQNEIHKDLSLKDNDPLHSSISDQSKPSVSPTDPQTSPANKKNQAAFSDESDDDLFTSHKKSNVNAKPSDSSVSSTNKTPSDQAAGVVDSLSDRVKADGKSGRLGFFDYDDDDEDLFLGSKKTNSLAGQEGVANGLADEDTEDLFGSKSAKTKEIDKSKSSAGLFSTEDEDLFIKNSSNEKLSNEGAVVGKSSLITDDHRDNDKHDKHDNNDDNKDDNNDDDSDDDLFSFTKRKTSDEPRSEPSKVAVKGTLSIAGATTTSSNTDLFGDPEVMKTTEPAPYQNKDKLSDGKHDLFDSGVLSEDSIVFGVSQNGASDCDKKSNEEVLKDEHSDKKSYTEAKNRTGTEEVDGLFGSKKKVPVASNVNLAKPLPIRSAKPTSAIGKLQSNLVINPSALMPSATPPKPEVKQVSADFDLPAQVDTLHSALKTRVKGQNKRKPPSRQGRLRKITVSSIDETDADSYDSLINGHSLASSDGLGINISTETITSTNIDPELFTGSKPSLDNSIFDGTSSKNVSEIPPDESNHQSTEKMNKQRNSLGKQQRNTSHEDIFGSSPPEFKGLPKTEPGDSRLEMDASQTLSDSEDIFQSKAKSKSKVKNNKSLFFDEEGEDDDLFSSKPRKKFNENEIEDIFSSKSSKPRTKRVSKAKKEQIKIQDQQDIFEDPLSALK